MKKLKLWRWLLLAALIAGPVSYSYAVDISDSTVWSETDASNTSSTEPGFPEGMAPSRVNDAARAVMGAVKRFVNRLSGIPISGGSANAYTLTLTATPATYANQIWTFRANHANSATSSLNINSIGSRTIVKAGASGYEALAASDIGLDAHVMVSWDHTTSQFVLLNPSSANSSTLTRLTNAQTTAGSGNNFTATYTAVPTTYANQLWLLRADRANSATSNLNINSLGSRTIVKPATNGYVALAASDIPVNGHALVSWDHTTNQFVLLNPRNQYEEGTWTPTIIGTGTAGSHTHTTQIGTYIRQNDVVTAWGRVALSATDASSTSGLVINGLPYFGRVSPSGGRYPCSVSSITGLDLTSGFTMVLAHVNPSSARVTFQQTGSGQTAASINVTAMRSTVELSVTCQYPPFN